jgi:hypothetical protein
VDDVRGLAVIDDGAPVLPRDGEVDDNEGEVDAVPWEWKSRSSSSPGSVRRWTEWSSASVQFRRGPGKLLEAQNGEQKRD